MHSGALLRLVIADCDAMPEHRHKIGLYGSTVASAQSMCNKTTDNSIANVIKTINITTNNMLMLMG